MNNDDLDNCSESQELYRKLLKMHDHLDAEFLSKYKRSLPFNEEIGDRWRRAEKLGFGHNTSIYDSSLVFGEPNVGASCWIGPFTIIDGSGGLTIGNYCSVSTGVHIYSHDSIKNTLTSGSAKIERSPVIIGDNVYIAPNSIITKGVTIGNCTVIAAFTLVNMDIPNNSIVAGQPGRIIGRVRYDHEDVYLEYDKVETNEC